VIFAGIDTLMYIMSKMASSHETVSEIHHYERLEFLGDAVIEFLSRCTSLSCHVLSHTMSLCITHNCTFTSSMCGKL